LVVHGGALENYRSFLFINPKLNLGFALLVNQGGLLPTIMGFRAARDGLVEIVHGKQPERGRPRAMADSPNVRDFFPWFF
jgi:hypothetical protein